jgi:phosphodiesterase/alkaline phosphatase D-like protein
MRTCRLALTVLASTAVFSAGLAFAGVSAFAVTKHVMLPFSPFGSGANLTGVAVDQSDGNVFVLDIGSGLVRVFGAEGGAPAGGIPGELTGAQTPAGGFAPLSVPHAGVAVDNACFQHGLSGAACTTFDSSDGDIYVTDTLHNVVDKFRVNGSGYEYVCQFTGFGFAKSACLKNEPSVEETPSEVTFQFPPGVAVDREGDVYIADIGSRAIYEFNSKGEDIRRIPGPPALKPGGESTPQNMTIDATGDIYVHGSNAESGVVEIKRSSFTGEAEGEAVIVPAEISPRPTSVALDLVTKRLFVGFESFLTEYSEVGEDQGSFGSEALGEASGVAVNETTGDIYVTDRAGDQVKAFTPLLTLGSATTGGASSVGRTSATVAGTVNPESETLEGSCEVQYGTSPALGLAAPCSPATVGVGEAPVEVTAELPGLQAGTLYYYRVVAVNAEGADPGPEEQTLTTVPAVEGVLTGEATEVGKASATLSGALKPDGVDAHYYFEYGESEAYGSLIPALPGTDAGTGNLTTEEVLPATVTPAGLKANTTYYYRLVASNEFGVTPATEGKSFKTLPIDPRVLSQSATQILPREALLGAVVVPEESNTTYHFAYGPTAGYGSSAPVGDIELGEGSEGLQALLSVSGLEPGTTYHYAVVATNAGGSTLGPDETFTTPAAALPIVVSGVSGEVSQNAASISGTVDPQGVPTSYEWDLGTDTTYGTRISGEAGSSSEPQTLTLSLQGLAAGTTYHYRLVARNTYGTVYGADETFTTPGFPMALLGSPAGAPLVPTPVFTVPSLSGIVGSVGTPGRKAKHRARKKPKARRRAGKGKRAGKASARAGKASGRGVGGWGR